MNSVEYGPYQQHLSDGLDFYKATMSQMAYEQAPDARVTFSFKNRGSEKLTNYVDPYVLQARLDGIAARGFTKSELEYFATITLGEEKPLFTEDYIAYIQDKQLDPVTVTTDQITEDIIIEASGDWPMISFWETVVMAEINEQYFEQYAAKNGLSISDLYDEGERRLDEKIQTLRANPGIKFADFGTRRHFSYRWQRHVVERLAAELPEQFLGTSNIGLANDLNLQPIGTFAHEMPMVYAALADKNGDDIRESHGKMLDDWFARYGKVLSTALTDTFGTDFFYNDFGGKRAADWKGVRHDSGDPVEFGEKTIAFYEANGIDPITKTIVFSDGLDIDEIVRLYTYFEGRIGIVFGWGTTLTNDLGVKALNIVMKATNADGATTVKLSDVTTKHTGDQATIERYQNVFA